VIWEGPGFIPAQFSIVSFAPHHIAPGFTCDFFFLQILRSDAALMSQEVTPSHSLTKIWPIRKRPDHPP